jgi:hypothetical protein
LNSLHSCTHNNFSRACSLFWRLFASLLPHWQKENKNLPKKKSLRQEGQNRNSILCSFLPPRPDDDQEETLSRF